jgi:hypothetical protein
MHLLSHSGTKGNTVVKPHIVSERSKNSLFMDIYAVIEAMGEARDLETVRALSGELRGYVKSLEHLPHWSGGALPQEQLRWAKMGPREAVIALMDSELKTTEASLGEIVDGLLAKGATEWGNDAQKLKENVRRAVSYPGQHELEWSLTDESDPLNSRIRRRGGSIKNHRIA